MSNEQHIDETGAALGLNVSLKGKAPPEHVQVLIPQFGFHPNAATPPHYSSLSLKERSGVMRERTEKISVSISMLFLGVSLDMFSAHKDLILVFW
jgi:hypothetical protein